MTNARPLTAEDVSELLLGSNLPLRLTEVCHDIATAEGLADLNRARANGHRLVVDGNATLLGTAANERGATWIMQQSDAKIHDEELKRSRRSGKRGPMSGCPRPRMKDYEVHLLRDAYVVIPVRREPAPAADLDTAPAA